MTAKAIRSLSGLIAEVLSVALPVIVIWLVSSEYNYIVVSSSPEWAVGAIILFGQACVKFTTSIAAVRSAKGPMSLIISALVTGLVISCYLLVRATRVELKVFACTRCGTQQVIWFWVAVTVYLGLGLLCDLGLEETKIKTNS